eukprot:g49849.t1
MFLSGLLTQCACDYIFCQSTYPHNYTVAIALQTNHLGPTVKSLKLGPTGKHGCWEHCPSAKMEEHFPPGQQYRRFFFPDFNRAQTELFLGDCKLGRYLLRPSSSRKNCLVISISQHKTTVHLLIIQEEDGMWTAEQKAWEGHSMQNARFTTVDALLDRLHKDRLIGQGITPADVNATLLGKVGKKCFQSTMKPELVPLVKYRAFLKGILADGQLSQAEKVQVDRFRREYHINDHHHRQVLEQLGITVAQFDEMVKPDPDACRACQSAKPDVLFLPCRHLVMCRNCARDVAKLSAVGWQFEVPACPLLVGRSLSRQSRCQASDSASITYHKLHQ